MEAGLRFDTGEALAFTVARFARQWTKPHYSGF